MKEVIIPTGSITGERIALAAVSAPKSSNAPTRAEAGNRNRLSPPITILVRCGDCQANSAPNCHEDPVQPQFPDHLRKTVGLECSWEKFRLNGQFGEWLSFLAVYQDSRSVQVGRSLQLEQIDFFQSCLPEHIRNLLWLRAIVKWQVSAHLFSKVMVS
ncbi:MAG: hypothetical protein A4E49_01415 [Methanosaeta sp. PtaU1.Bin112]|nr:MAG: hypothetical protein A4E49_01415 [Methanosaeta sp. PtaU1.Bin112]